MDYRHTFFVRKDTHIKYLFEIILRPNKISKRIFPFRARVVSFFNNVDENTINAQWIISTTQTPFSRQLTIMIKITDSWCYKERNERHTAMSYTRVIEVKEVTDWCQGKIKWISYVRGYKTYQPYWSYYVWYHSCTLNHYCFIRVEVGREVERVLKCWDK